mmetsp:Transcript_22785/g.79609  ORF Transcript_22785/g.79609 Transcript_22785/m.79609 type:complete len:203 (-) Transcript_22785:700-1308(-)
MRRGEERRRVRLQRRRVRGDEAHGRPEGCQGQEPRPGVPLRPEGAERRVAARHARVRRPARLQVPADAHGRRHLCAPRAAHPPRAPHRRAARAAVRAVGHEGREHGAQLVPRVVLRAAGVPAAVIAGQDGALQGPDRAHLPPPLADAGEHGLGRHRVAAGAGVRGRAGHARLPRGVHHAVPRRLLHEPHRHPHADRAAHRAA